MVRKLRGGNDARSPGLELALAIERVTGIPASDWVTSGREAA